MSKLFISHATADRELVEHELIGLLSALGFDIWFAEESISTSEQWERSILKGLETSQWFLIILSPESEKSEWVKDELAWAVDHLPDRIVPILIKDCNFRNFHLRLPRIQYVDYRKKTNVACNKLISYLVTHEYKSKTIVRELSRLMECSSKEILTLLKIKEEEGNTKVTVVGANARANEFFGRRRGKSIIGSTTEDLFDILSHWMDPDSFNNFVADQHNLSIALSRGEELYASVPMLINDRHPLEGFRGHSFIPITIAYSDLERSLSKTIEYFVVMYLDLHEVSNGLKNQISNS